MTVPVQTIYNIHTANGSTTVFPFTFRILTADDLTVEVDGVKQASGFTVSGVGANDGGNATFAVRPAAGSVVTLRRAMAMRRDTDYQDNGDLLADTVNTDFDRTVMLIQQVEQEAGNALQEKLGTNQYDVTGKRIVGLPSPTIDSEAVSKAYVDQLFTSKADEAVHQAAASATAAAGSATAAAGSATAAAGSATSASGSAATATAQATAATTQASEASASATSAAASLHDAQVAKTAAEAAVTAAQDANANIATETAAAQTAASAAQFSATSAAGYSAAAQARAGEASTAKTASETAQHAAEAARDSAQATAAGIAPLSDFAHCLDVVDTANNVPYFKGEVLINDKKAVAPGTKYTTLGWLCNLRVANMLKGWVKMALFQDSRSAAGVSAQAVRLRLSAHDSVTGEEAVMDLRSRGNTLINYGPTIAAYETFAPAGGLQYSPELSTRLFEGGAWDTGTFRASATVQATRDNTKATSARLHLAADDSRLGGSVARDFILWDTGAVSVMCDATRGTRQAVIIDKSNTFLDGTGTYINQPIVTNLANGSSVTEQVSQSVAVFLRSFVFTAGGTSRQFDFLWNGTITTPYGTVSQSPSDRRLKHDIQDADKGAGERIDQIRPRQFRWNEGVFAGPDRVNRGYIAQELADADPMYVFEGATNAEGVSYLQVDQTAIISDLIATVQELRTQVADLTGRVKELEAR